MGMTMTQKILAAHAGLPSVSAGQLIEAELDLVLGNDITSPVAIHEMDKMKVDGVFDKDKVALVLDHFVPNKDIKSAEHCKCVREFACRHDITNYFDVGEMGIEHALLPEKGLVVPGDCAAPGKRTYRGRRCNHWCRLPYLYLRSTWSILYRCRKYGYGGRNGNRKGMV